MTGEDSNQSYSRGTNTLVANVAWELFKWQELGHLRYGPDGPGLVVDPPEAGGNPDGVYSRIAPCLTPLTDQAFELLHAYIAVHNDILGQPLLRSLRRILPFPGIFTPIHFAKHAAELAKTIEELKRLGSRAGSLVDDYRGRTTGARFLLKVQKYCSALENCVSDLMTLCLRLEETERHPEQLAWAAYRLALAAYEAKRKVYSAVGTELNSAAKALRQRATMPAS